MADIIGIAKDTMRAIVLERDATIFEKPEHKPSEEIPLYLQKLKERMEQKEEP
jgi:hypothetical protein